MGIGIGIGIGIGGGIGSVVSNDFIFNVKTDNAGTSNNDQFALPLVSSFNGVTAEVDWGDGSTDTITAFNQPEVTHTYASAGTYTIKISNALRGFKFNNGGDKLKLLNISNWGVLEINEGARFYGCENMTCTATDAPTISTTNLESTFRDCSSFNGVIGNWDVSGVTNMRDMFYNAIVFNQPLNSWDVSSVTNMDNILRSADAFNQDLNSWDVSSVTIMKFALAGADVFNGNIGNWNVSSVTNMSDLFRNSDSFNQSLSNWDVGNVTNMINMFRDNDIFDQDLSSWNIVSVAFATSFMFNAGGFSVANYDALLIGWEATLQAAFPSGTGYTLTPAWNFGGSQYTSGGAAANARASLVSNFNWTIIDGGTA